MTITPSNPWPSSPVRGKHMGHMETTLQMPGTSLNSRYRFRMVLSSDSLAIREGCSMLWVPTWLLFPQECHSTKRWLECIARPPWCLSSPRYFLFAFKSNKTAGTRIGQSGCSATSSSIWTPSAVYVCIITIMVCVCCLVCTIFY